MILTTPYASHARRGDLILARNPRTDRTEVAQLVGHLVERDRATVHFADRRYTSIRLSDVAAPFDGGT